MTRPESLGNGDASNQELDFVIANIGTMREIADVTGDKSLVTDAITTALPYSRELRNRVVSAQDSTGDEDPWI